jgi:hypothetical protein
MSWNPNADTDCAFGLEWAPLREVDRPVGGTGETSYSWVMESTATETVTKMWTFSSVAVPNAYDVIDIYDAATVQPVNRTVDRYSYTDDADSSLFIRPTGGRWYSANSRVESVDQTRMDDVSPTPDKWVNLLGDPSVEGLYAGYLNLIGPVFDDPVPVINRQFLGLVPTPLTPVAGDYTSSFSQWAFYVDDLESGVGGQRIIGLTVACLCQRIVEPRARSGEYDQPYRIRPAISVDGIIRWGQAQIMPSSPSVVSYTWYQNPNTGRAWTEAELEDFNTTEQDNSVMWLMSRPNDPEVRQVTAGVIYEAWADVEVVTETRAAQAIRVDDQQFFGWNEWDVETIGGTDWVKGSGNSYLFNARIFQQQSVDWRPALSTQGLSIRALGDGSGPQNGVYETQPEFLYGIPRTVGNQTDYAPAVVLYDDDANALSDDGQPYAYITDGDGELGLVRDPDRPQLWQGVTFTPQVGVDYKVRFWARSITEAQPDSFMVVYVVDSNYVLEATSPIIRPSDLQFPGKWQKFELELVEDAWNTSDSDHIVMFVVYGGGSEGWQVLTLNTGITRPNATIASEDVDVVTYGGDAYYAAGGDVEGNPGGDPWVLREDADVSVVVGATPEMPTGFSATYVDFDTGVYGPSVTLEWDGQDDPDDCSLLGYYEIQRKTLVVSGNNFDTGWQTIFYADVDGTEETYSVSDYEANRSSLGVSENHYRIRLVSDIGFTSEWSEEIEIVIPDDERCGYFLSTNEVPPLNLWFNDVGTRSYEFLETVSYYEFEGRDGAVEARGLTDRLDQFAVDFLLTAAGAANFTPDISTFDNQGRRIFDRLLFLAGNKRPLSEPFTQLVRLPYVCVTDNNGNRWFSSIQTPTGVDTEPGSQYRMQTTIRELTRTPSPVTVVDSGDGVLISLQLLAILAPALEPPTPPAPFVPSS